MTGSPLHRENGKRNLWNLEILPKYKKNVVNILCAFSPKLPDSEDHRNGHREILWFRLYGEKTGKTRAV